MPAKMDFKDMVTDSNGKRTSSKYTLSMARRARVRYYWPVDHQRCEKHPDSPKKAANGECVECNRARLRRSKWRKKGMSESEIQERERIHLLKRDVELREIKQAEENARMAGAKELTTEQKWMYLEGWKDNPKFRDDSPIWETLDIETQIELVKIVEAKSINEVNWDNAVEVVNKALSS